MVYDTERRYYVYLWKIKETGEVFYVGKGTGKRYLTRKRENKFFTNMLNSHECESIIYKDNLNEKEAFELEKEMIAYYRKTDCRLTNVLEGGENPPKHYGQFTKEHKDNISQALKRHYIEHPEDCQKNSKRMKAFLSSENSEDFRRKSLEAKRTPEFRLAQAKRSKEALNTEEFHKRHSEVMTEVNNRPEIRARHTGNKNVNAQKVQQFDLKGNFIAEYETVVETSRVTGVAYSKICAVARGNRKTSGGYKWTYPEEKHIRFSNRKKSKINENTLKPVLQYDRNGNLLAEYKSIADVARKNEGYERTNIICNLKGRTKHAYGFIWKYKYDNTVPSL